VQFLSSDEDEKRQAMVQNDGPGPSGSRWEPASPPGVEGVPTSAPPSVDAGDGRQVDGSRRRRRFPLAALLVTLLGAGAVTAGAAYAQGPASTPGVPTGASSSRVAGSEGDGRFAHGADGDGDEPHGDHRRGPRTGDEQPLPSGDPS
jgi:hypothetical protein